jgi:hypothetical protein
MLSGQAAVLLATWLGVMGVVGCAAESPGGAGTSAGGSGGVAGVAGSSGSGAIGGTGGGGGVAGVAGSSGTGAIGGTGGTGGTGGVAVDPVVDRTCNVDASLAAQLTDPNVAVGGNTRWLYPYENTVFPRGLVGPTLQWEGGPSAPQAALVRITSQYVQLERCITINAARVPIPQDAWDLAGDQSRGRNDPTTIEVVIAGGGQATKLPPRVVIFALASLNSAVYYNTYQSVIASQMGINGGVVMRILPKATKAEVFLTAQNTGTSCIGCHAVSADGSRIVAEEHLGGGLFEGSSSVFAVTSNTRSEERRVGKECRRLCRSRWSPYH